MTMLGMLKEIVCGGFIPRKACVTVEPGIRAADKLNGEKEKLKKLCLDLDNMRGEMDMVKDDLGAITTAIREAPEQESDHCDACPLKKMQAGLKKKKRSRNRG